MLKRIGVGLLAIITYAICLELGKPCENPGLAQLCLHCRGRHRPSADADELRRGCAPDRAAVCGGYVLLLDPGDHLG